ncbi:MAG: polyprenyl synthetase family protein, partial [Alphaproteobacteria bacterium]
MMVAGEYFRRCCAANFDYVESALRGALEYGGCFGSEVKAYTGADGGASGRGNSSGVDLRLCGALEYALFSGGGRLRPNFVIESRRLFGGGDDLLMGRAVAAIELVHSFSLVHDDLPALDDDDERRGVASLHCAYDEATAVLAGDMLLSLSFGYLSVGGGDFGVELARGVMAMVRGQSMDIGSRVGGVEAWELLARGKTGALFGTACVLGAMVGGASVEARGLLRLYGESVGMAYQVVDDLKDYTGADGGSDVSGDGGSNNIVECLGLEVAGEVLARHCLRGREALLELKKLGLTVDDRGDDRVDG